MQANPIQFLKYKQIKQQALLCLHTIFRGINSKSQLYTSNFFDILNYDKKLKEQQFQYRPANAYMYKTAYHFSMPKPYASLNLNNKFPEDIGCIIHSPHPAQGSLYISNIEAAENLNTLKKHRITAVMSCAKGYELKHPQSAIPHYKYIPTVDKDECDISCHFDEAVDFITKHLTHTNVLVHCIAGVSRSVSMVLAYFIREHKMDYNQAYHLVKSKRKIIHPNDGFIKQLKRYSETKSKTQEKRRDFSPLNKTSGPTSTKRNNYFDSTELTQFKCTQLIEDSTKAKEYQSPLAQYKSNQLTPKKLDYPPSTSKNQHSTINDGLYRTSTSFFTPSKASYGITKEQLIQDYANNAKTQNLNRYPTTDKHINIQNIENRQQYRTISPTKKVEAQPADTTKQAGRKQQFQEMNRELAQKIEKIRLKYENQRKKLYERYQSGEKKYESVNSTTFNKNTTTNFHSDKDSIQDRKVSLTVDRYKERKDDYIRSPILREDKASAQPRDRLNVGAFDGLDIGELYNKKFENIYTTKGYKNDYRWQSRYEGGRLDRAGGRGYNDYLRYNYDYSFKRY